MNKLLIGAFALAAISTGAYAAADDHGGNGQDNPAFFQTNSDSYTDTNALSVAPGNRDSGKEDYLNWRQLR